MFSISPQGPREFARNAPLFSAGAIFLAVCGLLSGCSSAGPENVVTGKVTLDNEPVVGTVVFQGADGKKIDTRIDVRGIYFISPPPGKYQVAVVGLQPLTPDEIEATKKAQDKGPDGVPATKGTISGVAPPEKYADPAKSGLIVEVTKGKQSFDIPLTK